MIPLQAPRAVIAAAILCFLTTWLVGSPGNNYHAHGALRSLGRQRITSTHKTTSIRIYHHVPSVGAALSVSSRQFVFFLPQRPALRNFTEVACLWVTVASRSPAPFPPRKRAAFSPRFFNAQIWFGSLGHANRVPVEATRSLIWAGQLSGDGEDRQWNVSSDFSRRL